MKSLALTTAAINLGATTSSTVAGVSPFNAGRDGCIYNPTAATITITQSVDNVTYTALATVTTLSFANIAELPLYIKASAVGAYLLN